MAATVRTEVLVTLGPGTQLFEVRAGTQRLLRTGVLTVNRQERAGEGGASLEAQVEGVSWPLSSELPALQSSPWKYTFPAGRDQPAGTYFCGKKLKLFKYSKVRRWGGDAVCCTGTVEPDARAAR